MTPEATVRSGIAGPTAYSLQGQGEPVVLLHGVGMARAIWAPQLQDLAREHQVLTYDLLGHGQSALPPPDVQLAGYADQLLGLLDHLGIASAHVVGHSMGALIALEFALAQPRRTRSVAALNAVFDRSHAQRAAVQARAAALQQTGLAASVEPTLERWFGKPVPPALQEPAAITERLLRSVDPVGYARTYALFASADRAHVDRLRGLAVPALFMTAEHDPNSSPAMSAAMARLVPGARLEVLPQARHMMTVTHPQAVNAVLRDFIGQACRPSRAP